MKIKNICFVGFTFCLLACSCGNKTTQSNNITEYTQISPDFNADSAYHFVNKQVEFGPRVLNTPQHVACGNYLVAELKRFGAEVTEQPADLKAYDGTVMKARNIIGAFSPEKRNRILLFAHWDTRPVSDHDSNPDNHNKPLLGANDGASGVGVLLEIARVIQMQSPTLGIDIIFFDAEDNGVPDFKEEVPGDWWCLGSEYWSKNPHVANYTARFGILLDMVGAPEAIFYKEGLSMHYAEKIVNKVWNTARLLGYDNYFINKQQYGGVTDDHVPVNENRNIPSIDIIQHDVNSKNGFAWYWHTQDDDMKNISRETLKAVGQTVLEVIYKEK